VYAGVMALVLPIKWSLFFAGDVIGLALPTSEGFSRYIYIYIA
jgi:hypothetical protein